MPDNVHARAGGKIYPCDLLMSASMWSMKEPHIDVGDPAPQGWCVCGKKVPIAGAVEVVLPNGKDGWQGTCPECGAPLFAIKRKLKST